MEKVEKKIMWLKKEGERDKSKWKKDKIERDKR